MNIRTSRLSAVAGTVLLAVALSVSTIPSGGATPHQAAPSGSRTADPQAGPEDDFHGYSGVAASGADATPAKADQPKQRGFGPVGRPKPGATDVPGQEVEAAPAEAAAAVPAAKAVGDSRAALRRDVRRDGKVRVIVTMNMDVALEADLSRRKVVAQRDGIAARLATLDRALASSRSRVLSRFTVVPSAVAVLDRAGLGG